MLRVCLKWILWKPLASSPSESAPQPALTSSSAPLLPLTAAPLLSRLQMAPRVKRMVRLDRVSLSLSVTGAHLPLCPSCTSPKWLLFRPAWTLFAWSVNLMSTFQSPGSALLDSVFVVSLQEEGGFGRKLGAVTCLIKKEKKSTVLLFYWLVHLEQGCPNFSHGGPNIKKQTLWGGTVWLGLCPVSVQFEFRFCSDSVQY